jgi:ATP-dependent RNA helicase DDX46/PRP5
LTCFGTQTLGLVVNYSCPNHIEDYIHRIGRTGRAGRKGLAYTFITPNEAQYARDLIKALTVRCIATI